MDGHIRLTDFGLSKSGIADNNSARVHRPLSAAASAYLAAAAAAVAAVAYAALHGSFSAFAAWGL